ncbi:MAG: TetR/AcrR family transcriptional regulator [Sphingomonadales bacterium]|nr:TetR/AcrR family transcriptional regulator [Sphingomonadales bacterium]
MNAPEHIPSPPRAGRPTRAQAEARHGELLDAALDHFLEKGFELATVEAIAASVNMTKRTVYARYPEKVALFRAAVAQAIAGLAVSEEKMRAAMAPDIEQTLVNIARLRVDPLATPAGLKLQRIIQTESYRFPDIFTLSFEKGALPVIRFLGELLERETAAGRLAITDPALAANVFISMVVSGPIRILTAGLRVTAEEVDHRIRYAVRLFLDGARAR